MDNKLKFIKHEIIENGISKTNYFINEQPVGEKTFNSMVDNDFEKYKNKHINNIELDDEYIKALEEDYKNSNFEDIDSYNCNCERCNWIMDLAKIIRECNTNEEAFDELKDAINYIEELNSNMCTINTIRENANLLLEFANKIEQDMLEDED